MGAGLKNISERTKVPEKFVNPVESTHTAAEVLHGSSAMGGYCFIPRC